MKQLLAALLMGLCLCGCSTVKEWSEYAENLVKEKVLITTGDPVTVQALRWDGKEWVPVEMDIPAGYYILPPLSELLGVK